MVAIVLMGNASPAKGKGKEGQTPMAIVKLGRYAVLVQLLKALDRLDTGAKIENRLKSYVEQLESRLAVMLEAGVSILADTMIRVLICKEKEAKLPDDYRALLCNLFHRLREISGSTKK